MIPTEFVYCQQSPLGWLKLMGTEKEITSITFMEEAPEENSPEIPACLQQAGAQLTEYFAGTRKTFSLPLAPPGTGFQQKVWEQLQQIPFGQTESYLAVALRLGEPTYTRAVGSANGRNPLAIVVPCHRVIGSNGALTGYAGGLWRKKWLLQFEGQLKQTELFPL